MYEIGKKPFKLPSLMAHHVSAKSSVDNQQLPRLGIS